MKEAKLVETDAGLEPDGEGWFVINARESRWGHTPDSGSYTSFESREARFPAVGVNIHVLPPGQPNAMYHAEGEQEDFLVLFGECVAIVEGEERRLRQWDLLHCPPGTRHVLVGAGEAPCGILMIGARGHSDELLYPLDPVAEKHGAAALTETTSGREAYAHRTPPEDGPYRPGTLPDEGG